MAFIMARLECEDIIFGVAQVVIHDNDIARAINKQAEQASAFGLA
jgi:hypothetical protein